MRNVFAVIRRAAHVDASVLITGESGTGKEVVARTLHHHGRRAQKPFLPINCTAIPETLLESELFGHVRGAFTGAVATKRGLFERADGGTLFLDEIGDMGAGLQAKLLRVLQDHEVRPVGSTQAVKVDVRIIAATNRDLDAEMEAGRFREDLYYRLNVIPIHLPPLRERPEDVPVARGGVRAQAQRRAARGASRATRSRGCRRTTWRGNARELVEASCAIPGYFSPVTIDGARYVDGGVHSTTNGDLLGDLDPRPDLVLVSAPMSAVSGAVPRSKTLSLRQLVRRQLAGEVGTLRRSGH